MFLSWSRSSGDRLKVRFARPLPPGTAEIRPTARSRPFRISSGTAGNNHFRT